MNIANTIISMAILIILPLLLTKVFEKIDKELNIKLRLKDSIIIVVVAITISPIYSMIYESTLELINVSLIIAYLVFMSYTDQKTKMLYSSVSIAMIIIEIAICLINYDKLNMNEYSWTILIVPLALFIISMFRGIGLGDVYIYIVICCYYILTRTIPTMSIILNILLTNIMFVIATLFKRFILKDKEKHYPLTIYIAISTVICNLLSI